MSDYNEGGEMTPTINLENEQVNGVNMDYVESDYESVMTESDESDEDDNVKGEEDNEDSDEEVVIDQPLNNEQMPCFSGDFAPYFKNITESLFFCWMEKHHICK
jgi:hypothetical protein